MVKVDSSYHQWWVLWTGPELNSEIWNFLDSSYCFGHHGQSVAPIDTKPLGLVRRRAPLRHRCVGFPNIIKMASEKWSENQKWEWPAVCNLEVELCMADRSRPVGQGWPTGHDRSGPLWHYSSKHGRPVKTGRSLFLLVFFLSFFYFLLSLLLSLLPSSFSPPWVFIQGSKSALLVINWAK